MDREKVIKGLEYHLKELSVGKTCFECNYCGDNPCEIHLITDALALLKEQKAQLMTLDEVKAFDWDYCYLEEERLPGKGYRIICGDYTLTCITWAGVTSMRIQHGDGSYGKKWRCWSAKPTDEQRKVAKWDD